MNGSSQTGSSWEHRAAAALPLVIFVALAWLLRSYAGEISRGGEGWRTGDWLISYEAGFVRRGLMGTGLFWLHDLGLPLLWTVFALNASVYAAIFGLVFAIYRSRERGAEWLLLLLNPTFVLFPIFDLQGGFRKEILVFLAFSGLALAYVRGQHWRATAVAVLALFIVGCFSHEGSVFTTPFFLFLLWKSHAVGLVSRREAMAFGAAFSVSAAAAALLAAMWAGDAGTVVDLCRSIEARGLDPSLCAGAISDLDKGPAYFRMQLMHFGGGFSYLRTYGLLLALALLPLTLLDGLRRELLTLMVVGFLAVLPLFALAIDWGRWIHLYVFFVFTTVLAESTRTDLRVRRLPIAFALVYLGAWNAPHCCATHSGIGFWGLLTDLLHRITNVIVRAAML